MTFPGVATQAGPVDMAALVRGKDDLVAGMRAEKYVDLAAAYGWQIIHGTARFAGTAGAPRLEVSLEDGGSTTIEAGHYLTATGSAPQVPPIPGLEEAGYLTSTTAMELTEPPESMAVIGGNAVGLELGQLFARLGTRVTIVEALGRLAPFDEPEISAAIGDVLGDEGTDVLTGATVTGVRRDGRGRSVTLKTAAGGERELACGQVLVATGRRPVSAGLNLARRRCADRQPRRDRHRREAADRQPADLGGRGRHGRPAVRLHRRRPGFRRRRQRSLRGGYGGQGDGGREPPMPGNRPPGLAGHSEREVDYTALPRVTFTSPAIARPASPRPNWSGPG